MTDDPDRLHRQLLVREYHRAEERAFWRTFALVALVIAAMAAIAIIIVPTLNPTMLVVSRQLVAALMHAGLPYSIAATVVSVANGLLIAVLMFVPWWALLRGGRR